MDLVIILVLMGLVIFFFKKFDSFIYCLGIIDIFLRIISFIKVELLKGEIFNIIDKYVPENMPALIDTYSSGLLYTILLWLYVAGMVVFEFYLIKSFFVRRK